MGEIRLRLCATGLVLIAATGCGSTLALSGAQDANSQNLSGSQTNPSAAANTATGTNGAPGNNATTTLGGDATNSDATNGDSSTPGSASSTGTNDNSGQTSDGTEPASVPTNASQTYGTSTSPIDVGIPYVSSAQNNAIGGGIGAGLASDNMMELYTDYINAINKKGGINGRPIKPIFFEVDETTPLAEIDQEICSYFTQDQKVSFVISPQAAGTLYSCLSHKGVAAIEDGLQEISAQEEANAPLAFLPDSLALDRYSSIEATQFNQMGFFGHGPTAKLGVLYFDNDQASEAGYSALGSALSPLGVKIDASIGIDEAGSDAGLGAMEASVSSAELRFASERVNEVICVENNAFICGFFALYASKEDYYPKYAFSSAQVLSNVIANVPAVELKGSVFLGWYPAEDLQTEAGDPPALEACFTFFRQAGVSLTTGNERTGAETACSDISFFVAALKAAPQVSAEGLVQGAERISGSYNPLGTFGESFTATRHDGVDTIRRGAFVPSCDCFQYTGGNIGI